MKYTWIDYCATYTSSVDRLFDSEAMRFTGCDNGFLAFYNYWKGELGDGEFFAKVIFDADELIGVIALAISDEGILTVQELVIAPGRRGNGIGTAVIREMLNSVTAIIGREIVSIEAVVFPKNVASQRAFMKAGFKEASRDDGGIRYVYSQNR